MKRVLVVAYHFPPVGGAGVQRTVKFVRYLRELGFASIVVTGPVTRAGSRWEPEDATLLAEVPGDTEVVRVSKPPTASGWREPASRWLRVQRPFKGWWVGEVARIGARFGQVDVIFATMSPFESGTAAARLARVLGKPWVADLRDPWALDEMYVAPTGLHRRLELRLMRRTLRSAAAVVMNTPEAALQLRSHCPELDAQRVVSIPNGFDSADFDGPSPTRSDHAFRIVHTGYLHTALANAHRRATWSHLLGGSVQGLDIMTRSHVFLMQAIEQVVADEPRLTRRVELHLAGITTRADVAALSEVVPVVLHGYLPHHESIELVRSADLLFLPMHDLPPGVRSQIVPGKTYEYLRAGRPLLAAVPDGDARDLLVGVPWASVCRPSDVPAMAAVIRAAIGGGERERDGESPGELLAAFERRAQAAQLAEVLRRAIEGERPHAG